jgi:hypothetical protein
LFPISPLCLPDLKASFDVGDEKVYMAGLGILVCRRNASVFACAKKITFSVLHINLIQA